MLCQWTLRLRLLKRISPTSAGVSFKMECNLICGFCRARLPLLHPEKTVTPRSATLSCLSLSHMHTHANRSRCTGSSWHVYWQSLESHFHISTWFASLACQRQRGSTFSPDATGYSINVFRLTWQKERRREEYCSLVFNDDYRRLFIFSVPDLWLKKQTKKNVLLGTI